jgi:hypothetical protein
MLAFIAKQILNFFFFGVVLTKMVRDAGISCFSNWQAQKFFPPPRTIAGERVVEMLEYNAL